MVDYGLRVAQRSDISRVLELTKGYEFKRVGDYDSNGTPIPLNREDVEPLVDKDNDRFWVAYMQGSNDIIGCVALEKRNSNAVLRYLFVEEQYRRNGVGSDLISCVIDEAEKISNEIDGEIELWAEEHAVFEKAGFKRDDEGKSVYKIPREFGNPDRL